MVMVAGICQIHVGDDLEERHCLPCVGGLDRRAMEGRISLSSTNIVCFKFVYTGSDSRVGLVVHVEHCIDCFQPAIYGSAKP